MKKVLSAIATVALAWGAFAAEFNVTADGNDQLYTEGGATQWIGQPVLGVGYDSSQLEKSAVIPFQLPDIGGESIASADLETYSEDSPWGLGLSVDLYGVRVDSSSVTVYSNDFYKGAWDTSGANGTAIQQAYDVKVAGNPAPANARTNNCSLTGQLALAAYLQGIYDSDPAAAGKYVFLRLNVDQDYTSTQNSYIIFDSASGTTAPPVLKITTGAAAPTAGFTASATSGWAPLEVTFSDVSAGDITSRFWDFGDGTTTNTTLTEVMHTYAATGTYTVALTVSGALGSDTNTQVDLITVSAPVAPTASFSADPVSGRIPFAITFTDTSTGDITNRYWDFGDGTTTNTAAVSVDYTYSATGIYTVAMTASGPAGSDSITQTNLITVEPELAANMMEIFSDAVDASIGVDTNGIPKVYWNGQPTLTASDDGYVNSSGDMCAIMVFQLPELDGDVITDADLSVLFEADWVQSSPVPEDNVLPKWLDLYGVRTDSSSTVLTNDYGFKTIGTNDTLLQQQFVVQDANEEMDYEAASTDAGGDAALAAWIQAQYDAGAVAGDYIFLRAHAAFASTGKFNIASGNTVTPPTLTLTLTDGGPQNPPAPFQAASTSLGAGADVISWTTEAGYTYSVWVSTNLLEGFQPLETNLTDSVTSITNTSTTSPVFYKIEAQW